MTIGHENSCHALYEFPGVQFVIGLVKETNGDRCKTTPSTHQKINRFDQKREQKASFVNILQNKNQHRASA